MRRLIALVTAANVGSVATLTGNPQNMLVGSFSGISYRTFLAREAPIAIVGLVCVFAVTALVYRRQLPNARLEITPDTRLAVHYPLMFKTINAILVMLVAFLAGVPIAIVAIAGAAWTLFTRRVNPEKVYREINWSLLVLFAGLALAITATGIAGVIGFSVGARRREFGIRMALGALPRAVRAMVLFQGMRLVAVGLGIGLAGAFLLSRLWSGLLYDVAPTDPMTYGAVALGLGAVAAAACFLPARRATSVDPRVALRNG